MGCAASRNAVCNNGKCVCGPDTCAQGPTCVAAKMYDPSMTCPNHKPCGCARLRGNEKDAHICLNYMQCGTSFTPGICSNEKVHMSFDITTDGFHTSNINVSTFDFKCCMDRLPHPSTIMMMASSPQASKVEN